MQVTTFGTAAIAMFGKTTFYKDIQKLFMKLKSKKKKLAILRISLRIYYIVCWTWSCRNNCSCRKHWGMRIHCTEFVPIDLEILPSGQHWTYCCWIRALNVNFSIFCTLLFHTSLMGPNYILKTISCTLDLLAKYMHSTKNLFQFLSISAHDRNPSNRVIRYR